MRQKIEALIEAGKLPSIAGSFSALKDAVNLGNDALFEGKTDEEAQQVVLAEL